MRAASAKPGRGMLAGQHFGRWGCDRRKSETVVEVLVVSVGPGSTLATSWGAGRCRSRWPFGRSRPVSARGRARAVHDEGRGRAGPGAGPNTAPLKEWAIMMCIADFDRVHEASSLCSGNSRCVGTGCRCRRRGRAAVDAPARSSKARRGVRISTSSRVVGEQAQGLLEAGGDASTPGDATAPPLPTWAGDQLEPGGCGNAPPSGTGPPPHCRTKLSSRMGRLGRQAAASRGVPEAGRRSPLGMDDKARNSAGAPRDPGAANPRAKHRRRSSHASGRCRRASRPADFPAPCKAIPVQVRRPQPAPHHGPDTAEATAGPGIPDGVQMRLPMLAAGQETARGLRHVGRHTGNRRLLSARRTAF